MKFKKYILILLTLLIISSPILYYFPIQKYFAEKTLEKYMYFQGCSNAKIKSKQILKDYKIGGYTIEIIYKDDPGYTYEYIYFPGESSLKRSMNCIVFDRENVDVDVTNKKVKYPPID
ncbi:DUF3139 domain-containing protein [Inediibacterium massiliense]|uniref:DUF3139 domain-containing protein n=1 Tax=Inediibacterium massiliense TaxID=1658111 RepID=UPI0006B593F9|nr:DUF3139 domain-containing protein [Inediibacterium massiliense]